MPAHLHRIAGAPNPCWSSIRNACSQYAAKRAEEDARLRQEYDQAAADLSDLQEMLQQANAREIADAVRCKLLLTACWAQRCIPPARRSSACAHSKSNAVLITSATTLMTFAQMRSARYRLREIQTGLCCHAGAHS